METPHKVPDLDNRDEEKISDEEVLNHVMSQVLKFGEAKSSKFQDWMNYHHAPSNFHVMTSLHMEFHGTKRY